MDAGTSLAAVLRCMRKADRGGPFGFVGVSAYKGGQLFSTDYRVNAGDAGASLSAYFSAPSRVPPPGILKSDEDAGRPLLLFNSFYIRARTRLRNGSSSNTESGVTS